MLNALADRLRGSWRLLVKEVAAFGLVGAVSFVIDLGLFTVLYHNGSGPNVATIVSTLVATTVAYIGNRHWSFSHRARTGLRREATYFFAINIAILIPTLAITSLFAYPLHYKNDGLVMFAVKVATIGIGTVIRFITYKRFVFLHPDKAASLAVTAESRQRNRV